MKTGLEREHSQLAEIFFFFAHHFKRQVEIKETNWMLQSPEDEKEETGSSVLLPQICQNPEL